MNVPPITIPNFRPKCSKSIPVFRPKRLKTHTLWGGTYLYSLNRGVPPPGTRSSTRSPTRRPIASKSNSNSSRNYNIVLVLAVFFANWLHLEHLFRYLRALPTIRVHPELDGPTLDIVHSLLEGLFLNLVPRVLSLPFSR